MSCANKSCAKDISGLFRRKRKCLKCKQKFCSSCFMVLLNSGSTNLKGYCNTCYMKVKPEVVNDFKYLGEDIPTSKSYSEFLNSNIEPIKANPWGEFLKINKIGEGTTADVFKVSNSSGQIFALKEIKVSIQMLDIYAEYSRTVLCENTNIIKSFALYRFNSKYSILLEYMDMTLFNLIDTWEKNDENLMGYIIKQILKGLEYIHNSYTIHRDLKTGNILINHLGEVKISDFGLCAQLFRDRDERETMAGSPLWTAPEVLKGKKYSSKCDVWSMGMICFELIDGVPAFSDSVNMFDLSMKVSKGSEPRIPETWSQDFQDFVASCLKFDPDERLSVAELLNTNFVKKVNELSAKDKLGLLVQRKLEE